MDNERKVRMRCPKCASTEVCGTASTYWCESTQTWDLGSLYDGAACNDCDFESDNIRDFEEEIPVEIPTSG